MSEPDLAAWMGGVTAEIDMVRRASSGLANGTQLSLQPIMCTSSRLSATEITRSTPASRRYGGVTPARLRPTTPARINAIETSLIVVTDSPSQSMPTAAVPAAPRPVHTA